MVRDSNQTIQKKTKTKISNTLSNKTYEEIHGKNAELERTKRKKGAINQWKQIDSFVKKETINKISNTLKKYWEQHPEAKRQKIYKCPYCQKTGGNTMFRWHFDNCKNK